MSQIVVRRRELLRWMTFSSPTLYLAGCGGGLGNGDPTPESTPNFTIPSSNQLVSSPQLQTATLANPLVTLYAYSGQSLTPTITDLAAALYNLTSAGDRFDEENLCYAFNGKNSLAVVQSVSGVLSGIFAISFWAKSANSAHTQVVAIGAGNPQSGDRSTRPELGRIQISFVEFEKRQGRATTPIMDSIRLALKGIPGATISVDQEQNGPPTDPPINIEISSDNFENLTATASALKNYLDSIQVPGVEELNMDVDLTNPEITLNIDRRRALIEGVSTAQIGQQIRTALFGREISKIKDNKEEYKIQLRNTEVQRRNLSDLLNMKIVFREPTGAIKSIPITNLVNIDYTSTYGSIKRKALKRVITLYSSVLTGYTPPAVNAQLKDAIDNFRGKQDGVEIMQTGEGKQQQETVSFLGSALLIALMLILFILVLQFNSISKPVIILTEIIFSIIGVLLGFGISGMTISAVMTGLGIVGLAGIVVKNGILVIEFADVLRERGMKTREALIQAGKTRIIPVLLTALAAILALIPLAIGFNINFVTLFSDLNPHIFFGGDSAVFWKPLSWTIIFGLAFAFFMTLFILPSMYLISERLKRPMRRYFGGRWISMMGIPPLTFVFILVLVPITLIRHSIEKAGRKRRLAGKDVSNTWIGSWF